MKRIVLVMVLLAALAACTGKPAQAVRVLLETSLGDIELELYPAAAPLTVANFLRLVDGGYLDGGSFYRTVSPENDNGSPPISVIQGGLGDAESPFAPIAHETTGVTGLVHRDGSISMARAEVGTASTEFFICIGDQPALDFGGTRNADGQGFAVFGRVVAGMEVVHAIHRSPADTPTDAAYFRNQVLNEPVQFISLRRL
ncbi:MAG: peptidylprolyl isomerase [Gammaproteobacteria bacterium]|nr:peptidylprolyl isomerase [Gammaproteobacteria bacterium]MDH5304614.1 peptidylprolyl isomerase [Gammaproteobacteria bacterium]MDH5322084.1 peptidylprolyl isomerase [Gammaproteobacteria bacterium]